jgi:hypothetical protein
MLVEEMAPYVHELLDMPTPPGAASNGTDLRGAELHVHGLGHHRRLRLPSPARRHRPGLSHRLLLSRPGDGRARGDPARAIQARVERYARLRRGVAACLPPRALGGRPGALPRRQAVPDLGQAVPLAAGRQGHRDLQPPRQPAGRALRPRVEGAAAGDCREGPRPKSRSTPSPGSCTGCSRRSTTRGCSTSTPRQQMRRWRIVPETQSFREMWHGGDLSHGWCSTPLVQMSVARAGRNTGHFARLQDRSPFAPTLCDLTWAKGRRADSARRRGRLLGLA